MDIRERLACCFRTALEPPEGTDVAALLYRGIEQWDSVGHMVLVAEIESEFNVMLDTDQVIGLSSFEVAMETLEELGVADG